MKTTETNDMQFYSLSKWRLIDKHFVSTFGFETAKEAREHALKNQNKYNDQDYVAVVKARSVNHAREIVAKKGYKL